MAKTQYLDTNAAFALGVKHLQDRLADQMEEAMKMCGLVIPGKTTAIVQLLYSEGQYSTAEIARRLRYSHQLTTQRLSWLLKHGMATTRIDQEDRRRQTVELTRLGTAQATKLQEFLPKLSAAYVHLFQELGLDLDAAIAKANSALVDKPLMERFPTKSVRARVGLT